MRVLHIVKTSDGARWAALQARELVRIGVETHVALPSLEGRTMPVWRGSGAQLHQCRLTLAGARRIVDQVRPDLIHTHFVSSTLMMRAALGRSHSTPRIFQVPGPLHLEHAPYRMAELALAGGGDHWIASSRCIRALYRRAGLAPDRVFLSYYGFDTTAFEPRRRQAHREKLVVGNVNLIYKPKWYLGQLTGLKAHEHVIEALGIVTRRRADVVGLLAGGPWGKAQRYFERLRLLAWRSGKGRILMPGPYASNEVPGIWADFDCAVHVPLSENCGGVVEPLAAGIPTIAGRVGGLPEVVIDQVTGVTVPIRNPEMLAEAILTVLEDLPRYRRMAQTGRELVRTMFGVERTAAEVKQVYEYVLGRTRTRPSEFDSGLVAQALSPAH